MFLSSSEQFQLCLLSPSLANTNTTAFSDSPEQTFSNLPEGDLTGALPIMDSGPQTRSHWPVLPLFMALAIFLQFWQDEIIEMVSSVLRDAIGTVAVVAFLLFLIEGIRAAVRHSPQTGLHTQHPFCPPLSHRCPGGFKRHRDKEESALSTPKPRDDLRLSHRDHRPDPWTEFRADRVLKTTGGGLNNVPWKAPGASMVEAEGRKEPRVPILGERTRRRTSVPEHISHGPSLGCVRVNATDPDQVQPLILQIGADSGWNL